tara:strand:- start:190 stop:495 length:306 start_codon:yes stop_codon:yes gene_type:complete
MKLIPLNDKVVVKPKKKTEDDVTESGIILPDTVDQGKLLEGEVISVGEGMYSIAGELIAMVVGVGDRVLYSQNSGGQEYNLNGETVLLISQNELLSVIIEE